MTFSASTLPNEWRSVALGELVSSRSGNSKLIKGKLSAEESEGLYQGYSASGPDVWLEEYAYDSEAIIISAVGAKCGKCFLAKGKWTAIANTHIIFKKSQAIDLSYLWRFVNNSDFWVRGGAAQPFVKVTDSMRLMIPLPPLPEQHRIVEILDQADALRQQRRQADEISRKIAPALFYDAFGDLRRNPKHWETLELGQVAEIVSGITKGRRTSETSLREIAYLSVANVQDGHLRLDNVKRIEASEAEIERFRLMRNDLVLTEGGDPDKLGRGALWTSEMNECIHQNHVFRVRVTSPKILPTFLAALTGSEYGKAYFLSVAKKTTGIASINKTQLSAFPVVIPPLGIQERFVDAISSLNGSSVSQATSAATLGTLFQTLLHRAFDGSLTAKWREAHAQELLQEMEHQAR